MKYTSLGRSPIEVSRLCLGGMNFGRTADERDTFAILDAFVDAGGTFIDTANIYYGWVLGNVGGESETIIGRWMAARQNRNRLITATKVGERMWPGPRGAGLSRAHLVTAVDDSLRRLQVDTIDLYQAHSPDDAVPIGESLAVFADLISAGKVRAVGLSNFNAAQLREALDAADRLGVPVVSLQPHYNLVHRFEYELALQPICVDEDLAVLPYSPLAAGFLTGKYRKGDQMRARVKKYAKRAGWATLDVLRDVAAARGASPGTVALAWFLAQPGVTAPIIGASTAVQLYEPLAALDLQLTPGELHRLHEVSAPLAAPPLHR